jgi:hypothetical protein
MTGASVAVKGPIVGLVVVSVASVDFEGPGVTKKVGDGFIDGALVGATTGRMAGFILGLKVWLANGLGEGLGIGDAPGLETGDFVGAHVGEPIGDVDGAQTGGETGWVRVGPVFGCSVKSGGMTIGLASDATGLKAGDVAGANIGNRVGDADGILAGAELG